MPDGRTAVLERARQRQAGLANWCRRHLPEHEPIVLELGCGHGHFLTAYAQTHPARTCVGLDLISRRVEKATAKAGKRGLSRLHFLKAEAAEFLAAMAGHAQADLIFMLFPDPWPKKRHHKNRMIQPGFLTQLAEVATPDARFCFRTDHDGYFFWTAEHLWQHPHWSLHANDAWPLECETVFQSRMTAYRSLVARNIEWTEAGK